ncbi:MAG: hypothetical protein ABIH63_01140 [archaeon]
MLENKLKGITAKVLPLFAIYHFANATPVFAEPNSRSMHSFIAGRLLENEGRLNDSLKSYFDALDNDSTSATILNSIAEVYIRRDLPGMALFYLRDAVKHDPEYLEARSNLAGVYVSNTDYTKGLEHAIFVISRKPDDVLALNSAGESYYKMHNFSESRKYFGKTVELDTHEPSAMFAWHRLGMMDFSESKFRDAIDKLKRSIWRVNNNSPDDRLIVYQNLYYITISYYTLEEFDEAKNHLDFLYAALKYERNPSVSEKVKSFNLKSVEEQIKKAIQSKSKKATPSTAIPR